MTPSSPINVVAKSEADAKTSTAMNTTTDRRGSPSSTTSTTRSPNQPGTLSPNSPSVRPSSAGKTRNLRRRFTTPPEVSTVNQTGSGSISSLQYYTLFPDRENAESISTDVFVTSAETIDDIQTLIINQSDHLRSLRLRSCTQLTATNLHEIIRCVTPKLLSFEIREAEENNIFDLDHLQHLVSKCKHLRAVHFEDCFLIDHRCLEQIGKHLLELQNIAFVHTKKRPWPDNPIHETVLHVPLELHSLKFVGFDEIADYHVNYAVDCYFGSLNAISLGDCSQITDRSVEYIATNCKLLRHIELFKTNITDSTLWILAKHCSNLFYIDLSHCSKITDYGIKELVAHATHLRYINLSWNLKIKDLAFQSIVRHCTSIVRIKLDGTSVTRIPASIIKRKTTLREVSLSMCKEMAPDGLTADLQTPAGLAAFIDGREDRNLNYRLKVFFLGASGTGKSELIRALIGKADVLENIQEGVQVQTWRPLKESTFDGLINRDITDDERDLHLDLWACHGRDVLRGVHPVYFTDVCVYFVLCNFEDSASVEKVPKYIHGIYAKTVRPQIYVVATRAEKYSDEDCLAKLELIKRSIDSAEVVRRNSINVELALMEELGANQSVHPRTHELQRQAADKYQIRKILPISVTTGKGMDVLRKQFLNLCLDVNTFQHLKRAVPPGWVELQDEILKLRDTKVACLTWHEFEELAIRDDRVSKPRLDECVGFLHQIGVILDLRTSHAFSPLDLLCIDPAVLAYCACALHIDDQKKSFRFEAKRFWPKDQVHRPPEANVLAMALEDIPNRGLLKESLLPLIWQEFLDGETQVLRMRDAMLQAALLAVNKSSRLASDTLMLPGFPHLLPQTQFVIPLLGLLPDAKPQLNWTSRPFHGDVQISLYHYFLPVMPPGLNHRLVALVNNALIDKSAYHYYWKFGTLTRISDILLFVSCEQDEYLEISARVTAEDENDTACVESLWLELVYIMNMVAQFMSTSWVGVRTTVSLICYGDVFYMEEKIDTEPEVTLAKVFHYAKIKEEIQFKDSGEDKFLDTSKLIPPDFGPTPDQELHEWIKKLLHHREKAQELQKLTPPLEVSHGQDSSSPSVSRPKKKKISINWSVQMSDSGTSHPDTASSDAQPAMVNGHQNASNGHSEHSDSPTINSETGSSQQIATEPEPAVTAAEPREKTPTTLVVPETTASTGAPPPSVATIPATSRPSTSKSSREHKPSVNGGVKPEPEKSVPAGPVSPRPIKSARASSTENNNTAPPPSNRASSAGAGKTRSKTCTIL